MGLSNYSRDREGEIDCGCVSEDEIIRLRIRSTLEKKKQCLRYMSTLSN